MPNMSVQKMSFADVFSDRVQYEIPFFQRGYSWEKENWEQLLTDIQENILDEFKGDKEFDDIEFFFGSIVIAETIKRNFPNMPRRFLVIDGQQRLTTVYIALAIVYNLLRKKENDLPELALTSEIGGIFRYIVNDVVSDDEYDKIKLLSCKGDKIPTYQTVFDTDQKPYSPTLSDDYYSYNERRNKLKSLSEYLKKFFSKKEVDDLIDWKNILLKSLKVVWIPIDENNDDIQSIFETLNDRGRPLTSSELICNYLFKPFAGEDDQRFNKLHTEKWLKTLGKIDNDGDIEGYLRTLFSLGEPVAIGSGKSVYIHIKKKFKNLKKEVASDLLDRISNNVEFYNEVTNPKNLSAHHKYRQSKIFSLLCDIADTRMESSRYFVMQVLQSHVRNDITQENVESILNELLTALVRRKISALPTNMYNRVFPSLYDKICVSQNIVESFVDEMVKAGIYVTDDIFSNSFIYNKLYTTSADLTFTRMVLKNIDKYHEPYEQCADYQNFDTVEHIMPRKLTPEWRRYLKDDANNQNLKKYVNSIGNLCLLNRRANSHASQCLFEEKVNNYPDASYLTRDLKKYDGVWNIKAITERSERLAKDAVQIWKWSYNKDNSYGASSPVYVNTKNELFYLIDRSGEADARGSLYEDGERFLVYKDSVCNRNISSDIEDIERIRENLLHKGVISKAEEGYVFIRDHIFTTPSAAAKVIRGGASNGWTYWKNIEGKSLDKCCRNQQSV